MQLSSLPLPKGWRRARSNVPIAMRKWKTSASTMERRLRGPARQQNQHRAQGLSGRYYGGAVCELCECKRLSSNDSFARERNLHDNLVGRMSCDNAIGSMNLRGPS